jgi:hypothetical protein
MPSLWTDDDSGHPWIAAQRHGPVPAAAPRPTPTATEPAPGIALGAKAVLFSAACAVAAIAGAAIQVLR